jgi:hypothetical protein
MFDRPKINLIIWSKDRACQLDLLLRSIKRFKLDEAFYVKVIYLASTPEFSSGYKQCENEHQFAHFEYQRNELRWHTEVAMLTKRRIDYTCFSTDDMVFVNDAPNLLDIINNKEFNESCVFSLRLGLNTIEQDIHAGTKQPALNKYVRDEDILRWNPHHYSALANYGYPLALDTHVFHTRFIQDLVYQLKWNTTNELEGALQPYRGEIRQIWSYTQSRSVNIPANSISGITRAGEVHGYSTKVLNDEYLAGKRIDLDAICDETIVGCHQEIELKLI